MTRMCAGRQNVVRGQHDYLDDLSISSNIKSTFPVLIQEDITSKQCYIRRSTMILDALLCFKRCLNTFLLVACRLEQLELVKSLLNKGAQVDCHDKSGRTCLHLAASRGSAKITEELLRRGAKSNLQEFERKRTALHLAVLAQSLETVKLLLAEGKSDPNAKDSDARSPLHMAVIKTADNCEQIVGALVESGAFMDGIDEFGLAPLHYAALNKNAAAVVMLIKKGADWKVKIKDAVSVPTLIAWNTPSVYMRIVRLVCFCFGIHSLFLSYYVFASASLYVSPDNVAIMTFFRDVFYVLAMDFSIMRVLFQLLEMIYGRIAVYQKSWDNVVRRSLGIIILNGLVLKYLRNYWLGPIMVLLNIFSWIDLYVAVMIP